MRSTFEAPYVGPSTVCTTVFESGVILNYLEDKYSDEGPTFTPPTPEGRQEMALLCRVHDLYIASPNTTAAGFSHSQGAMYLSAGWHGASRGMDLKTRSLKLGEIWRQLCYQMLCKTWCSIWCQTWHHIGCQILQQAMDVVPAQVPHWVPRRSRSHARSHAMITSD